MALEVYDDQQDGWVNVADASRIPTTPRVAFRSTGLDGTTTPQTIGEITVPGRPVRILAWGTQLGTGPNITAGDIKVGAVDPTGTDSTSVILATPSGTAHYAEGDLTSTAPRALHCSVPPERFNIELRNIAESLAGATFDIYIEVHQEF